MQLPCPRKLCPRKLYSCSRFAQEDDGITAFPAILLGHCRCLANKWRHSQIDIVYKNVGLCSWGASADIPCNLISASARPQLSPSSVLPEVLSRLTPADCHMCTLHVTAVATRSAVTCGSSGLPHVHAARDTNVCPEVLPPVAIMNWCALHIRIRQYTYGSVFLVYGSACRPSV
jgi:hypothetical protein